MATLRDRLRAGDIWVEGTRNYRRFDTYLLSRRDADKVADSLPFQTDAAAYLEERARTLDWRLRRFAKQLKANRLAGVALERDRLKLQPMPAITPRSEEHTSELQSLMRISFAVFCFKKKKLYPSL